MSMEIWGSLHLIKTVSFFLLLSSESSFANIPYIGQIYPGFQASQMNWTSNNGTFLKSNNSRYALGFLTTLDVNLFVLVVIHISSSRVIWTANRGLLVRNSDRFIFSKNGNVYLESGESVVFSTNTAGKSATTMELQDKGNLVLFAEGRRLIWQSYSHPTDTLISGQKFSVGMKLTSFPNVRNLTHHLEFRWGDLILYPQYKTLQPYWSMGKEYRKIINASGRNISSASLVSNSWNFYDENNLLIWQFTFSGNTDPNTTWTACLGPEGSISFYSLEEGPAIAERIKIPLDTCSVPEPCDPYSVCSTDNRCQCPSNLSSLPNCTPQILSPCNNSKNSFQLLHVGDRLDYFALGFVQPFVKTDLNGCQEACLGNCSCIVLFFENSSGNCFLFDQIGSFQRSTQNTDGFVSFLKVIHNGDDSIEGKKHIVFVVMISISTILIISGLIWLGLWYYQREKKLELPQENSEEDTFLDSLSGLPLRFTYDELRLATNNFSLKLGQGGFGSVYQGILPDGTSLAVKKLEGIGQGKKEFRAEVSSIGSIHHVHLVKLKGFCAEGTHRLLVYEHLSNGSLDKWIFKKSKEDGFILNWETRFKILLGTAKGLAYLHEDCDVKIVHCDIKPENVLLDENFLAKVSDFGLAKLMTREQSHVFTTLRGTRGYLAPEWITSHAISEKSDVYSFGMVVLEIIGGRKNFDPTENSEKTNFPSYAFKMMEEGKLEEIFDSKLEINYKDKSAFTAIKVALWCIQDDMNFRPSMTKVVQMLEGLCDVPQPPRSSHIVSQLYSSFFKSCSEEDAAELRPSDYNSEGILSDVRLSGPR